MSFNSFSAGIPANDNIMHITHADIKSLMQDSGLFRENESLWITGFVAANQMSSVLGEAQVEMYDAGGAYQVTFANTIQVSAHHRHNHISRHTPISGKSGQGTDCNAFWICSWRNLALFLPMAGL